MYDGIATAIAPEVVSHPVFYVTLRQPDGTSETHIVTVWTDGGSQDAETHHAALLLVFSHFNKTIG